MQEITAYRTAKIQKNNNIKRNNGNKKKTRKIGYEPECDEHNYTSKINEQTYIKYMSRSERSIKIKA